MAKRLKAALGRLRDALSYLAEISSRQQITRTGLIFSLACTLVGFAAFASANNLLFLVLAAMLGTLLISGFVSRLTLSGLELDLDLPPHIVAGRRISAKATVWNAKRWMTSFSVTMTAQGDGSLPQPLYFPAIASGGSAEAAVEMLFPRRGSYSDSRFVFSTRFPFGFAERRVPVHLRREFLVYPSIDPQPGFEEHLAAAGAELEARVRGAGSDFYRIRPYEALESVRHLDWKATAHTGDLQVREFARDEDCSVELCLDVDVDSGNREWFERAVAFCAYMLWRLSERGARIRFRTASFDSEIPRDGSVYRILRYLALVEPSPGQRPPAPGDARSFRVLVSRRANAWESGSGAGPVRVVTLEN